MAGIVNQECSECQNGFGVNPVAVITAITLRRVRCVLCQVVFDGRRGMNARRVIWLSGLAASLCAAYVVAADQPLKKHRRSEILLAALTPDRRALDLHEEVAPGTEKLYAEIESWIKELQPAQAVAQLAKFFLGKPYVASSLDSGGSERLWVDLTRFDCMLFVEQLLALALSSDWQSFVVKMRGMRYENGRVDYCARNHYFQAWAASAEDQGWVEDVTDRFPGYRRRMLNLNYMSNHSSLYAPLQRPSVLSCIEEKESRLNVEQLYIPNEGLHKLSAYFRDGDLFAIATSVPGLDVTHMGVVVLGAEGVSAIHAVPGQGVIRSIPFADYVRSVPDSVGVVVLRPSSKRDRIQEQPST